MKFHHRQPRCSTRTDEYGRCEANSYFSHANAPRSWNSCYCYVQILRKLQVMFNLESRAVHLFLYYGPVQFSKYPSQSNIVIPLFIFPVNCNPMLSSVTPSFSFPICVGKAHTEIFLLLSTLYFSCLSTRMTIKLANFLRSRLVLETLLRNWVWSRYEGYLDPQEDPS